MDACILVPRARRFLVTWLSRVVLGRRIGCMRKIAKHQTCARVARSVAENTSSFVNANSKSPKVGKNSFLWSKGSKIKVVIDFCLLFRPLKLDLESKAPIPSAIPAPFSRESRTSVTAIPNVIFPIAHPLLKLGRNLLPSRCTKNWIYTNLLSANMVQKSANEEEIGGKDGKWGIGIPVYMGF